MFRIQYYTDMHGLDFLPPVEERMVLINQLQLWKEAWERDDIIALPGDLMIPAREIRYMLITEVWA